MRLLMKCLWKVRHYVLIILLLLALNAAATLALPAFTSRIVNVGIQQEGFTEAVFEQLHVERYQQIISSLSPVEQELFAQAYQQVNQLYQLQAESDYQQIEALTIQSFASKEGFSSELAKQAAITAIAEEYRTLGVNVDQRRQRYILFTGLQMIGITLLAVTASIMVSFFSAKSAATIGRSLRQEVFSKVLSFSRPEMDKFSTATLITRSTNDIQRLQMSSVMFMRIVFLAPMMAIGGLLRILATDVSLAYVVGLGVGVIFLTVTTLLIFVMPRFKLFQRLIDQINLVMRERLTGLQVIRAFGTAKHEQERFDQVNTKTTNTALFVTRSMSALMPIMMLVMNMVTVLILYTGARRVDVGAMQVGDMMAFIQYTTQILMSFLMLSMLTIMLPRASVAGERIREVLSTPLSLEEGGSDEVAEHDLDFQEDAISFENVSFAYPGAESMAVSDISFTAKRGGTTAIIGSTGSGKSTLLHLMVRFYDVTSGTVKVNGRDVRSYSNEQLRSLIAYAPQKALLFSGTVRSNIEFALPEGEQAAEEKLLQKAAEIAQADEFIQAMADGYDSPISQGGSNVSGGQRQRLTIARSLASERPILLFDDSFSALDYRTDARLRQALREHLASATVIIVAQRISTIMHADRILVLEGGKIVGDGQHQELLKTCQVYRQIADSQLSLEELEA